MARLDIRTYMIIFLSVLVILNISHMGFWVARQVAVVVIVSLILDGLIIWIKERKFKFSKSSCISGLIILSILAPGQRWFIYILAPLFAIFSKHLIKISQRHIFNPAGFGLFLTQLFFSSVLAWWASSPVFLLIIFGLFIVYKMKRWEPTLSFLITSSLLLFSYALIKNAPLRDSLYLINPYFLFFMLTEPKTQPSSKKAQVIYAGLIAIFAFAGLVVSPKFDYSILALLIGNLSVPILNKWLK